MAIETYELNIKVNDDGTTATVRNIKNEIVLTGVAMKDVNAQFSQLGNISAGASVKIRATASEMEQLRMNTQGASMATGAASASLMEVGRVFLDMPYGIRGVANNLSQLSSQMAYMAAQTDLVTGKAKGMGGALKDMGKAFMGPLGILIAIQAAIAALEMFTEYMRKADKAAGSFATSGITTATVKLGLLKEFMDDSSVSLETKTELLVRANEEFDDLNLAMDKNGRLTTASANALAQYTSELVKMSQAKAIVELIEEQVKAQERLQVEGKATLTWYESLFFYLSSASALGPVDFAQLEIRDRLVESVGFLEEYKKKLGDKGLIPYIFGGADPDGNVKKAAKIFKQAFLDLEKEILNFQDRQQGDEKNIFKQLEQEQALEANLLQLKVDAFHEKMALEASQAAAYLEQGRITQEEYEERMANIEHQGNEANLEADLAFRELKIAQKVETDVLIEDQKRAHLRRLLSAEYEAATAENELAQEQAKYGLDRLALEKQQIDAAYVEKQRLNALAIADAKETGLAIADIEKQQSTDAANYAAETLANDRATTDARIQVMGHFGAAAGALSSLMGEQTAAGKVFAIAAATIQAYVAGAQTMADPTIPSGPAKIAAMIAVIASGMATVKKIITTKVPGKSNAGGGGAGPTTFNPNFNVVGQSGQNQLAEVVAGQTNEATRAYVVYDDIASAQNIEQNAVQSSSFG